VPPASASPPESKQEEKPKEKSKSFSASPESKLKGVSKKELPSKKSKDSPLTKAKKSSKGSQSIKKSSIGNIETSKILIKSESTESKESELDLDTKEDESKAFVDEVKDNEIIIESSTKENKHKDVETVKELVDETSIAEAVLVKQQVEECMISEPSLDTTRENSSTEELTTECVQESVNKDMTNNDISIFVTPPQVTDKPETPDSLVEEIETKLESTSEEVEKANVSDVDSQNCESRLSWATHIEEVEALEAIETQSLLKENMSVNEETSEEIVTSNNDDIASLESIHKNISNISSEVTEVIGGIETEVKKCEELKTPEEEDTSLQYEKSAENIVDSNIQVSFVDNSIDKFNEEVEGKDSSYSKYTNCEDYKEKEQIESVTIDTKGIEDHFTDIIEEITEDVEKHQVFEDACSEFYNDENNFIVEYCSSSGNLENNPNDEIKDADTISVESFESCAETVIYLDENKDGSSVVMDAIARPCSQTELIIVDDILSQYEFEQSLIDSYLIDYTPEVIESIHNQFQTSLSVESKTDGEKHMHENSESEKSELTEKLQDEIIKDVDDNMLEDNSVEGVIMEDFIVESKTVDNPSKTKVDESLLKPKKTIEEADTPNDIRDISQETVTDEISKVEIKAEEENKVILDKAVEVKKIHEIKMISDNNDEILKKDIVEPENKADQSRLDLDSISRVSKSKSPVEMQQANETIENFRRNLQFIASHPKFSNLHAQTMKLLSSELSKNVDSDILKAKLNKKELGYLVRKLDEKELGYLFFDGMDETCLDLSKDQILENISANLANIRQSQEYVCSKIIKNNVKFVESIVSAEDQDKYDIFQKLKELNLHSIALRNVGVKIVRIFSAQGSECVEIITPAVRRRS
jgi:hypothetical protein